MRRTALGVLGAFGVLVLAYACMSVTGFFETLKHMNRGPECWFKAEIQTWIDENEDGLWDAGEPPLAGTMFQFVRLRSHQRREVIPQTAETLKTNTEGKAKLSFVHDTERCGWPPFELVPEVPVGYRLVTSRQERDERGLVLFGFRKGSN